MSSRIPGAAPEPGIPAPAPDPGIRAQAAGYDLIVIGAGINGAAIAREAALGGCRVLVLEQADVASGTTSASTRLIHGGLRYLEHGELGLVRESLREREALLAAAPHLVRPLRLYLPIYSGSRRPRWQVHAGLTLYDLLSRGKSLPKHTMQSRGELLGRLPGLSDRGLVGGACYYDAQVRFPERLVVENLLDASAHGAAVINHAAATAIVPERGGCAVEWRGPHGAAGRAAAAAVVNAAGPWVDEVAGRVAGGAHAHGRRLVGGTKGSHLVVEPFRGAPADAVYAEAASDGRPFFVVPWNGVYLIGTTDVRYDGDPAAAVIDAAELAYLVAETERLFPGAGIGERVLYTQAGVRALPYRPGAVESAITRCHLIHAHREVPGLYSIVGGKLTTHSALAVQTLERLRRDGVLRTARSGAALRPLRPLPGAADAAERDALLEELGRKLGEPRAQRLWATYGRLAGPVAGLGSARPELAQPAGPGSRLLRGELVHAVEAEWADALTDVLLRRTMLGLGPDCGLAEAPAAAEALCELGFWDRARAEHEVGEYRRYVDARMPGSRGRGTDVSVARKPAESRR